MAAFHDLEQVIKASIRQNGPMDVGSYMSLCLSHPEYGYYMKQDPFGKSGDFVTAPEVSQLFGEMLGAWCADIWMQMGAPERFMFLECGPGRDTLMADMMRSTRMAKGFHAAAELHLLEISPALKAKQKETLADYKVEWHAGLDTVPDDAPMIVIGNEFFDALPFRSFQKQSDGQWAERVVALEGGGEQAGLCFGLCPLGVEMEGYIPFHLKGAQAGSIFEAAPVRQNVMRQIAERIKSQNGAALFLDYGHAQSGLGDSFQALKGHKYVDVLKFCGDADLTSHVDFEGLVQGLDRLVDVRGAVEQGAFLCALGIEVRMQMLAQKISEQEAFALQKGLQRLIASDQMGALFKVVYMGALDGHRKIEPCGF